MKANTSNARVTDQQTAAGHLDCCRMPAAVFMLLATTVCAQAQYEYTNYHHEITITKYTGAGGDVVIPGEIEGTPVVSIGPSAFSNCTTLTAVTIPEGVTSIGNYAFQECANLTSFTLPNTLTTLGGRAFYRCTSLTSITVPGSITQWPVATNYFTPGSGVFAECTNLTAVTLGEGISTIPPYAFLRCTSLGSVLLPSTLSSIGGFAFWFCSSLTGVTIPNSVTFLGAYAFFGCTSLTDITVPGGVTNWEVMTWPGLLGTPPLTVSGTFGVCTNLRTVTVEDGVTNIPAGAFGGCSHLPCITIPQSVTSVGTAPQTPGDIATVFGGCTNLTGIYFEGNCPSLLSALGASATTTVYYLPDTTGWGALYGGCPTAPWIPQMQAMDSSFGVRTTGFGFNVTWARDRVIVVEACTNLVNPDWSPVQTLTLTGGSAYFSDAEWRDHPARFYRVRSQ